MVGVPRNVRVSRLSKVVLTLSRNVTLAAPPIVAIPQIALILSNSEVPFSSEVPLMLAPRVKPWTVASVTVSV